MSFSKLYSLVPYQTYISVSKPPRHLRHSLQWPGCSSAEWYPQRVYRRWFRWQLLRAYENRTYRSSSSQIQLPQHSAFVRFPLLPQRPQRSPPPDGTLPLPEGLRLELMFCKSSFSSFDTPAVHPELVEGERPAAQDERSSPPFCKSPVRIHPLCLPQLPRPPSHSFRTSRCSRTLSFAKNPATGPPPLPLRGPAPPQATPAFRSASAFG